jgi:hypothetical protein
METRHWKLVNVPLSMIFEEFIEIKSKFNESV